MYYEDRDVTSLAPGPRAFIFAMGHLKLWGPAVCRSSRSPALFPQQGSKADLGPCLPWALRYKYQDPRTQGPEFASCPLGARVVGWIGATLGKDTVGPANGWCEDLHMLHDSSRRHYYILWHTLRVPGGCRSIFLIA